MKIARDSLIIIAITYGLLIVSDYGLLQYVQWRNSGLNKDATLIEAQREANEDIKLAQELMARGYTRAFSPLAVDENPEFERFASDLEIAPLGSQPNTNLILCNEGYGMVAFKSDRFGFRNPDNIWQNKGGLMLIGDSFINGACVADEFTLAGRLSNHLPTVSLGINGHHPYHYAAIAKSFIPARKPRYVVLAFYANDNGAHGLIRDDSFLVRTYFEQDRSFVIEGENGPQPAENNRKFFEDLPEFLKVYRDSAAQNGGAQNTASSLGTRALRYLTLPTIRSILATSFFADQTQLHASSRLAIDTVNRQCAEHQCQPIIVWLAGSTFWRPDSTAPQFRHALELYTNELGLIFLDTSEALKGGEELAYFAPKGPHYSKEGYAIVAQEILDQLMQLGMTTDVQAPSTEKQK